VPARPARGCLRKTSPSTRGAPHHGASTGEYSHITKPEVAQQAQERGLGEASSRRRPVAAETKGKPPQISSVGKLSMIPTGVGGRGSWGGGFAQASAAEATGVGRNGRATTAVI
jgi:hypothetical protein